MNETKDFYRLYHEYLRHINDNTYILDADKIWTERYNSISFPAFKTNLAKGKIFKDFQAELRNKVSLVLHDSVDNIKASVDEFFKHAHAFLNTMSSEHRRIDFETIKSSLPSSYDSLKREQFLETFRMLYATNNSLGGDIAAYCSIFTSQQDGRGTHDSFQLIQSGYENVANLYSSAFDRLIHTTDITVYCDLKDSIVKLSEFLNSLGVADYQRLGGDQPAIFVRINNPYYLNSLIRRRDYENDILSNIYEKYRFSERIFTYSFTTKMTDEQRWDFIEAYFLGESEERLLNFV
jgi:hypothetical protein